MSRHHAGDAHGASGYHGRPALKAPVWTWEVPLYFFVGGLGGAAALIAAVAAALLGGASGPLVDAGLWTALAATVMSAALLVMDLGRPGRFLNMLRVFKLSSPMSMGVWILNGFGAAVTLALAARIFELGAPVFWLGAAPAALLGALLATYTGVLLGVTVVPAWAAHDRALPVHFGAAGLGSGAAFLELVTGPSPPLATLAVVASIVEIALLGWLLARRHGARDRALRRGRAAWLLHGGAGLMGPLALAFRAFGAYEIGAVAFLAGALVNRYGWLAAGRASARDPRAAL